MQRALNCAIFTTGERYEKPAQKRCRAPLASAFLWLRLPQHPSPAEPPTSDSAGLKPAGGQIGHHGLPLPGQTWKQQQQPMFFFFASSLLWSSPSPSSSGGDTSFGCRMRRKGGESGEHELCGKEQQRELRAQKKKKGDRRATYMRRRADHGFLSRDRWPSRTDSCRETDGRRACLRTHQ